MSPFEEVRRAAQKVLDRRRSKEALMTDDQGKGPLARFFELQYSPEIHDVLASALRALDPVGECVRTCEFNLFDVVFDAEASSVKIADILDGSEAGVEVVPIREFAAALERAGKRHSR